MNEQESGHNLGDIRVAQFVHPDSIGVTVWEVEQLKEAKGKYAKNGDVYWDRITPGIEPFTSTYAVNRFLESAETGNPVTWIKR